MYTLSSKIEKQGNRSIVIPSSYHNPCFISKNDAMETDLGTNLDLTEKVLRKYRVVSAPRAFLRFFSANLIYSQISIQF